MGDENDGLFAVEAGEVLVALLLEGGVADGEDFVEDEDVALGADGNGEGEADLHAGGVVLEFGVHEGLEFGEADDFVVHGVHLFVGEAEEGAV